MAQCLTCKYNSYRELGDGIRDEWVSCIHPVTLARGPHWHKGDPTIVNYRTGDVPVSELRNFEECPTYEIAPVA